MLALQTTHASLIPSTSHGSLTPLRLTSTEPGINLDHHQVWPKCIHSHKKGRMYLFSCKPRRIGGEPRMETSTFLFCLSWHIGFVLRLVPFLAPIGCHSFQDNSLEKYKKTFPRNSPSKLLVSWLDCHILRAYANPWQRERNYQNWAKLI